MDTLLPCLQNVHRSQDLKVAARVRLWIGQPMLCEDPFSTEEYLEMKKAIDNAQKFSS